MTRLPTHTDRKLGLVIDLDTCVGCHACVIACKGWNTEHYGAPLSDQDPYGADPSGTFLNRVHSYEITPEIGAAQLVHFPKSCLHCEDAPCVTVCPTGASYKRVEDGIVLVNEADCIGCGLCAWACPYGAPRDGRRGRRHEENARSVSTGFTTRNLPPEDREPACVRTCPAGARHFGDLGDPDSDVSLLVAERGGCRPDARTGHETRQQVPAPPARKTRSGKPTSSPLSSSPWPTARRASSAGSTARWASSDMHPAPSVIAFTTLSGLGFGLLVFLGLGQPTVTGWTAFWFFLIAHTLAVGGLLASTFHLGRPERALKAFTQWQTSWLSREAWAAVAALVTMGLYAAAAVFLGTRIAPLGLIGAALSLGTVFTTAMIYAQLKTVPRWNQVLTPLHFLSASLGGGALLAGADHAPRPSCCWSRA